MESDNSLFTKCYQIRCTSFWCIIQLQAERYREGHGAINEDNLREYKTWLLGKSKINLDKRGITSENVFEISRSAEFDYMKKRYDEVEAEFQVIHGLRGK